MSKNTHLLRVLEPGPAYAGPGRLEFAEQGTLGGINGALYGEVPDLGQTVLKYAIATTEKEWEAYRLLSHARVELAEAYALVEPAVDYRGAMSGILLELLPNEAKGQLTPEQRQMVGRAFAQLHAVHVSGYGFQARLRHTTAEAYYAQRVELVTVSVGEVVGRTALGALHRAVQPIFRAMAAPSFLHNDPQDSNVIVRNGAAVPIDFEYWGGGDFHEELGKCLQRTLARAGDDAAYQDLRRGYDDVQPKKEIVDEAIYFHALLQAAELVELRRNSSDGAVQDSLHVLELVSTYANRHV